MPLVVLGLGSNVGSRKAMLDSACARLRPILSGFSRSSLYESKALLPEGAPADWDMPYLNGAVSGYTLLAPQALLEEVKRIEQELGRQARGHWGPREIDIDILAYGQEIIATEHLTVPHSQLAVRDFALLPLAELAPQWRFPSGPHAGKTAAEVARLARYGACLKRIYGSRRTQLAGIMNITPDSFSDGGKYVDAGMALPAIERMIEDGADIIDIGAESTRPGAQPVTPMEEWARLSPVLSQLSRLSHMALFSVDTRHAQTAQKALDSGAKIINDVSGFSDPAMVDAVRGYDCLLVVMHSLSVPADPAVTLPSDMDAVAEVLAFAHKRIDELASKGIARERIIFDPGIGFGKTPEQSLALLRGIGRFGELGVPLMVGHSRKSFLRQWQGERDDATLAVSQYLTGDGVSYLRVHDVLSHRQMLSIMEALT